MQLRMRSFLANIGDMQLDYYCCTYYLNLRLITTILFFVIKRQVKRWLPNQSLYFQYNRKFCAFTWGRVNFDGAAVLVDNLLGHGQSEAGSPTAFC